jgi:hypothetical protein
MTLRYDTAWRLRVKKMIQVTSTTTRNPNSISDSRQRRVTMNTLGYLKTG